MVPKALTSPAVAESRLTSGPQNPFSRLLSQQLQLEDDYFHVHEGGECLTIKMHVEHRGFSTVPESCLLH